MGVEVFDGPFTRFMMAFIERLRDVDRYQGIDLEALEFLEPEDLDELAEFEDIGPTPPRFEPF